ncbi:Cell division protein FtsK [Streptococcus sp. DD10]|nr:Cell division protein FtsK [Streptococcus sp. DD10]
MQALFVNRLGLTGNIFSTTFSRLLADITNLRVNYFVGGGMIGSALYAPISFLFSNIGSYFIGLLLIATGLLVLSNYSVYDIFEKLSVQIRFIQEKAAEKRESRFLEKERREAEKARKLAENKESNQVVEEIYVDMETGEVLDDTSLKPTPILLNDEVVADLEDDVEELEPQNDSEQRVWLAEEEDGSSDNNDFEVQFQPQKENLLYQLPTIDLFAPDKPKNQSKEKILFVRILKY